MYEDSSTVTSPAFLFLTATLSDYRTITQGLAAVKSCCCLLSITVQIRATDKIILHLTLSLFLTFLSLALSAPSITLVCSLPVSLAYFLSFSSHFVASATEPDLPDVTY